MGLSAIRDGIKTQLDTIAGLQVHDVIPDSVNAFPAAVVRPFSGEYDPEFGSPGPIYSFIITILVTRQDAPSAQDKLDPYLDAAGASSVRAAIEADTTLSASCDTCRVTRFGEYGAHRYDDGPPLFGVNIYLEVVP